MLTIRVNGIHGDSYIFQAATVIRGQNQESVCKMIEFLDAAHEKNHESVEYGNVYVMNENGKTVAIYELGGWPETPSA